MRFAMPVTSVLWVCCAAAAVSACDKSAAPTSKTSKPQPPEPLDEAATTLLTHLQSGDYDGLRPHTADPLTDDMSRPEFDDLAAIVQWLGPLRDRTPKETNRAYGGGQRRYALQFENAGPLELSVSIDPEGKLVGFEFQGEGYIEAERGVLAEPWREFKVYDFRFLGPNGTPMPEGAKLVGNRVDYELVVGGIEAFIGEHHLSIQKIVLDAEGNELFVEPVEYDAKFAADAMGIPRGVVHGHLEVPGAGRWELALSITDENAHRDTEYRRQFETVAP